MQTNNKILEEIESIFLKERCMSHSYVQNKYGVSFFRAQTYLEQLRTIHDKAVYDEFGMLRL